MKTYKSSDLTHKRAEVLKAAREEGVIIEERRSNGEVIEEYILITVSDAVGEGMPIDMWRGLHGYG